MTQRERMLLIMSGGVPDRFPLLAASFWKETIDRWENEGLPKGVEPNRLVGLTEGMFRAIPINLGFSPDFPVEVVESDANYVTLVDEFGVKKRMLRKDFEASGGLIRNAGITSSMSQWLEYPVRDHSSWEEVLKRRLHSDLEGRLPADWPVTRRQLLRDRESCLLAVSYFPLFGSFGALRQLMGAENLMLAMADDPGLVKRIMGDLAQFWRGVLTALSGEVTFDAISLFEDMCSSQGPLVSPSWFDQIFGEAVREFIDFSRGLGVRLFMLDSDGNCLRMIPSWIRIGITMILPCEAQAGMDPKEIRRLFPELAISGGIDKRVLTGGKDEICSEVRRKFAVAWRHGRYLPNVDHSVPPNVSWDNFRYYAEEYMGCAVSAP